MCDTPYSVVDGDKAEEYSIRKIVKTIKRLGCKHIVFTGGEPTLYQSFIIEVMKKLPKYTSEIESNGTIPISEEFGKIIDIFNLSIKLKSSNQLNKVYDKLRINYDSINTFPENKSFFKFVVTGKKDMDEILDLHLRYINIPVYLMPEGTTRETIIENSQTTVELCMKFNFIFCPREHIIIWNNKKGV